MIEAHELTERYGDTTAVHSLSFTIAPGTVTVFNTVGESWDWAFFYGLSIGLEVLLLAFILRSAWTWPRRTASPATLAASLDSEPLRTPQQA